MSRYLSKLVDEEFQKLLLEIGVYKDFIYFLGKKYNIDPKVITFYKAEYFHSVKRDLIGSNLSSQTDIETFLANFLRDMSKKKEEVNMNEEGAAFGSTAK